MDKGQLAAALGGRLQGRVFTSDYAAEIAPFNAAITHSPDLVAAPSTAEDVVRIVRFAREHRLPLTVQGTGHGAHAPITSGLLVSTRALRGVQVDPATRTATVAAGEAWAPVVAAAGEHGLAPITGSASTVGVVGYLLGGGVGPLARSHGFSSDYVTGFTVVTGQGELVTADATTNPDLFWALRGGKVGLGIVTEVRLRLVALRTFYAGALYFEEANIERALRGWIDWTKTSHAQATTSAFILRFPPFEFIPEPFRGRRILSLRFTFPGDAAEGERLAAPLRALAPVYLDALTEMPVTDVAKIHNDPPNPTPSWVCGTFLSDIDQDYASVILAEVGPGTSSPIIGAEIRHLGEATTKDVPEGSAVGGRPAAYAMGCLGNDPRLLAKEIPAAGSRFLDSVSRWACAESNVNYTPHRKDLYAKCWSQDATARLAEVRRRYDPDAVFS